MLHVEEISLPKFYRNMWQWKPKIPKLLFPSFNSNNRPFGLTIFFENNVLCLAGCYWIVFSKRYRQYDDRGNVESNGVDMSKQCLQRCFKTAGNSHKGAADLEFLKIPMGNVLTIVTIMWKCPNILVIDGTLLSSHSCRETLSWPLKNGTHFPSYISHPLTYRPTRQQRV